MRRKPRHTEAPQQMAPLEIGGVGSPSRCMVCNDCDSVVDFFLEWANNIVEGIAFEGPRKLLHLTARCRCLGRVRIVKFEEWNSEWKDRHSPEHWWMNEAFTEEIYGGHYP